MTSLISAVVVWSRAGSIDTVTLSVTAPTASWKSTVSTRPNSSTMPSRVTGAKPVSDAVMAHRPVRSAGR